MLSILGCDDVSNINKKAQAAWVSRLWAEVYETRPSLLQRAELQVVAVAITSVTCRTPHIVLSTNATVVVHHLGAHFCLMRVFA